MREYGSTAVLNDWLDRIIDVSNDLLSPFISIEDTDGVYWNEEKRIEKKISLADFEVIDFSIHPIPIQIAQSPFTDLDNILHQKKRDSIGLLWAQMKRLESNIEESCCGTSTSSHVVVDTPSPEDPSLSLVAPVQSVASSLCGLCGSPLLRSLLRSAPGYCEYSGLFICGTCFESRPVVVPHRLLNGCLTVTGNVSIVAAAEIADKMYNPVFSFQHLSEMVSNERTKSILLSVHRLRIRWQTLLIWVPDIPSIVNQLPVHMRETDSLFYSLGDLIDILSPRNYSTILKTFTLLVESVELRLKNAPGPSAVVCTLCEKRVYKWETEWTFCSHCEANFHRKCFNWVKDGCPKCVSLNLGTVL